jgi:tetratricopeptide (TPR) repeat protein
MCFRFLSPLLIAIFFLSNLSLKAQDIDLLQHQLASNTGIEKLTTLYDLTSVYRKNDLDTSILYARQAIDLAATLGNDSLLADANLRICPSFHFQGAADSVRKYALLARDMGQQLQSPEIYSYACQLIASSYEQQSMHDDALRFNLESLAGYRSFNDSIGIGAISNNLSRLYAKLGNFDEALSYALIAEQAAENTKRSVSAGLAAMNIAQIYDNLGREEKTRNYLQKAKRIFTRDSFPRRYASVLEFTGSLYLKQDKIDSAILCFEQVLVIYQGIRDPKSEAVTLGNLGSLYQELQAWDKSYAYLKQSLQLKQAFKDQNAIAYDLTNLGIHFDLQSKADSAEHYYLQAMVLAEAHDLSYVKETVTKQLFELFEKTGQYKKALDYHQQYFEHQEEIKGLATQQKIASLEVQYETEKKERQIEQLALQNQVQRSKSATLTIGLVSLFLLFGLIIAIVMYRRRQERRLHRLQEEIHHQEKLSLDQEVAFKAKQLTTHALHMVQKNKVLQEIKGEVLSLSKSVDAGSRKALRSLDRRINQNLRSDEDWDTFKLYFEQTNQGFYDSLAKVNDELSPTELRLCTLIKLNLNIKETASVLNIEPTSVKTARHRLRKKLKLDQGQDLAAFIRQVA